MQNLISLEYQGNPVRCIQKDGAPWWVLSDVCKVLDLSNSRMTARQLDDDEKGVSQIYTPGGNQKVTVINESGLYNVLLRSDKPEAKPFKRWVTHEVLPQIRTTGKYEAKPETEQLSLPADDELVDILELQRISGIDRNNIRSYVVQSDKFVRGQDYIVLRGKALAQYKRKAGASIHHCPALTVFTKSGVEKLIGYLEISEANKTAPNPEPLPFDEMMKLRYQRTTQAQMLLHIADRTPDANQRNYLYGVITDILLEEDIWTEEDGGYKGHSSDFRHNWLEGYGKRLNLDSACNLAKVGKPVTHAAIVEEIKRPKSIQAVAKSLKEKYKDDKTVKVVGAE